MFTDKFRLFKIITPLFIILAIVIYGEIKGPQLFPGYLEAIKNPSQFINKKISFGGKVLEIKDNYFYVESEKQPIKVFGKLTKDKINYLITGNALYQSNGSLKVLDFHLSNLRGYKIILSIIPIIFIGYLFFKEYKLDKKILTFVKH